MSSDKEREAIYACECMTATIEATSTSYDEWILNSYYSYHMTSNRDAFIDFHPIDDKRIILGNDTRCKANKVGSIIIYQDDTKEDVTLNDVMYVPTLKRNLIFLGCLEVKDCEFASRGGDMEIRKDDKIVLRRGRQHVYVLRDFTKKSAMTVPSPRTTALWKPATDAIKPHNLCLECGAPTRQCSQCEKEQVAVHPYPDRVAMQAYYGPGVPLPPPYFTTAVAPGHPPHPYMWIPQPFVPPFGTPYGAIYPHGVYSHPSVSLVASPSTTDLRVKSSSNKDNGFTKKPKGFDGLAVSIGNVNTETTVASSQSVENGAEESSNGSDDNNGLERKGTQRKRSSKVVPIPGNRKAGTLFNADHDVEAKAAQNLSYGITMPPSTIVGKPIGSIPAPYANQLKAGVYAQPWGQDENDKREKRKQCNRESARKSRLKKQAETEELAMKVESLNAENTDLISEIGWLKENTEKLKAENSTLTEKLKNVQEMVPVKLENQEVPSVVVENFLTKIGKFGEEEACESSSSGKLHQLLDPTRRTDAVAAI